ncbi:membrane protein [Reticulibacter mediterranei]|uniref:Membrane protein n=1 Tax=Reticulibacter mediterranei TaxID=2778369 RepID=A0A8J3I773_9CHLR|nr:MMPL family transporter [Reticulibacter mediterranei]GHO90059.1 membrane protein [Reticulibacter mediterranei]
MSSTSGVRENRRSTSEPGVTVSLFSRIGHFSVRHRWWVLVATLAFAVVSAIGSAGLGSRLDSGGFIVPGSESDRADTTLDKQFHTGDYNLVLLITAKQGNIDDPEIARVGVDLTKQLATQAGIAETISYWTSASAPTLRSRDGTQALVLARVSGNTTEARNRIGALAPRFIRDDAMMSVKVGGDDAVLQQSGLQSQQDLIRSESITLPILLVLLFFAFRSPLATILPLLMSILAITGTLLTLRVIVSFTQVSNFTLNMATALGLGLGVDYSLFIVSRFREEVRSGKEVQAAVVRAVETAGRIIAFSALTFGVSLAALLVSPNFFLRSFAYAGMAVIVVGAVCALLTLPAVLAILGHHIDRWTIGEQRIIANEEGFWHRTALFVMRFPVPVSVVVLALLVILGLPFLHITFSIVDDRILPVSASSRQVQELMRSNFTADEAHALHLVAADIAEPATQRTAIEHYAMALSRTPGVVQVDTFTGSYVHGVKIERPLDCSTCFMAERGIRLSVVPSQERVDKDAYGLVRDVRMLPAPFPVDVGGHIAESLDLQNSVIQQVPFVIGLVVLATFVILFLMTGSLVMPLKATLLNLLSLSATFGVLVWVFQDGNLSHLLGFTATGGLEIRTVVLVFCIAFGLSMDYEVFILGRIKEEYEKTGDTIHSVAVGMERSGPLVTAAAALLAVAFVALSTSDIVLFKLLGIGMTLAVLLDATIIRALLVPAFMRLMGRTNWWAPPVLQRLQQRIGLSDMETIQ